jgi:hypothetical protein
MRRKLIKQNKTFISIVIILFILFGLILYFGGNQIYKKEARWYNCDCSGFAVAKYETPRLFSRNYETV